MNNGQLEITLIDALPGTCSTALERALTQSPDVDFQIHEPFYYGPVTGLHIILSKLQQAEKWPAHIVIKEMSNFLDGTCLPEIAQRQIMLFRNPLSQVFSYGRRFCEAN